ncbi:DUF4190 domain-containing protein [Cellulomonas sp. APG4]|uniref:DUF4190 domain-containing protein n=1 Tax=Cellulomonas sp. APG4 TaxID=1538656 RepID=UPI001379CD23|nr:DUF4190 domain-containing protein [Cellulomonas sp. APG4]NCT90347.1 DUF4190 domain-containing protein [Cellulomonas sp. APG4]
MSSPERDGDPVDGAPEPSTPTDGWSAVDRLLGERAPDPAHTSPSGGWDDDRPSPEERGWPASRAHDDSGWPSSRGLEWPSEDDERAAASPAGPPTPAFPAPPAPATPPAPRPAPSTSPAARAPSTAPPVTPRDPYLTSPATQGSHASPSSSPWGPPAPATDPHAPHPTPPPTAATAPPGGWQQLEGTQWEGLAVAAFVVSVVSMFCLNLFGPVGIVLGAVALQRLAHSGRRGRGLAGWAIGVGVVSSIIGLLFLIGVLADEGLL